MQDYKLIIEYYEKGNNKTQIATLCGCSRALVWQVLKRVDYYQIKLADVKGINNRELSYIIFPERVRK